MANACCCLHPLCALLGRCTNLYLCAQSAAGVTLAGVAFKAAAGFILLASTFDGRYATGQLPSLEDYGRCVCGGGGLGLVAAAGFILCVVARGLGLVATAVLILLASTFDGRYATGQLPGLEDYGRCVRMHAGLVVLVCRDVLNLVFHC
jgi:hypothetical protein